MNKNGEMNVDARREKILNMLSAQGRVRVAELSALFGISEVTIRHDLAELEEQKLLLRVHGGAESTNRAYYTLSLTDRMKRNEDAKREIAKYAADIINDGDTVILDSGTTTLMVAQEIRYKKGITVVTNSLTIASELASAADANVILLGGSLNPKNLFAYGEDTVTQLQKYKADKMFMAVDGISAQYGVTTFHYLEADVSRSMRERANSVIAVADHTKIGREGFAKIGTIDIVDMLVTNESAGTDALSDIRNTGIEVVTV